MKWPFKAKEKYLALSEYWAFLPEAKLPNQDELIEWLFHQNPYGSFGPSEGLLFSDIRLHVGLVKRIKNALLFRPDVILESVDIDNTKLSALADSEAFAQVRFVSEEPFFSDAHIRVLPYLAAAMGPLASSTLIVDRVQNSMRMFAELDAELRADPKVVAPEFHTRVIWKKSDGIGHAESLGLIKLGLKEIISMDSDSDREVLIKEVMQEAVHKIWMEKDVPATMKIECFGDNFNIDFIPEKGKYRAKVSRG